MRLTELSPRWIHPNVLVFRCPHCKSDWLACKNATMSDKEQYALYEATFGEDWNLQVVPARADFAWNIVGGDFNSLTVTPSIDASASGHWHGHITQGEVR